MMGDKKCIALVSGGIDSPVAIARMLNDGWKIYCIHFSQSDIVGDSPLKKASLCLKHLLNLNGKLGDLARSNLVPEIIVISVGEQLANFTKKWCHSEYFIHMKRLFHKLAEVIGLELGVTHILTGENLGQVSSQTLGNLGAIEMMCQLKPLHPLLALDKRHIIDMARDIGTYDLSLTPEVCDAFGPNKPTTIANQEWLELSEKRVGGIDKLVFESMKNRYTLKLND